MADGAAPRPREIGGDEYEAELRKLWLMYSLLLHMPLQQMIEWASRADTIGPIVDPTLWREKGGKLRQDTKLMQAFRSVQLLAFDARD